MMYTLTELYRAAQDEGIDMVGNMFAAEELLSVFLPGVCRTDIIRKLGDAAIYLDTHYEFPYTPMDTVQRAIEIEQELNAG